MNHSAINQVRHQGIAAEEPGPSGQDRLLPEAVTGLSRQNSVYRRVIALSDELADAALQGADVNTLADLLARLLGKTVILLDADFELQTCRGPDGVCDAATVWDPGDTGVRRLLTALAEEGRPLRVPVVPDSVLASGCLATPIAVGNQKLGYLLVLPGEASSEAADADLLLASHAATLFALTLANERTTIDLGRRYQAAIVDALVSGHVIDLDDARRKAASLGLADGQAFRIGLVRIQCDGVQEIDDVTWSPQMQSVADGLAAAVPRVMPGAVAILRRAELVMVLPEDPGVDRMKAAHDMTGLADLLAERGFGLQLTCGVSEPTLRPDLAPRSLRQAECAADIGVRIGRAGQVVMYDELGIYRLLLQVEDLRHLSTFADEVLGPLVRYDASHRSELVRTLSVFLSEHASLKQTARRLRVHANTISYRVGRIEKLTQLNLTDPDDRLAAHVAVKILLSQRGVVASQTPQDRAG